jgi:cbb3-type cytochrome oxidase subunit 1
MLATVFQIAEALVTYLERGMLWPFVVCSLMIAMLTLSFNVSGNVVFAGPLSDRQAAPATQTYGGWSLKTLKDGVCWYSNTRMGSFSLMASLILLRSDLTVTDDIGREDWCNPVSIRGFNCSMPAAGIRVDSACRRSGSADGKQSLPLFHIIADRGRGR